MSNMTTRSLQTSEVGVTDTNPFTGHDSSRKKFLPTWGVLIPIEVAEDRVTGAGSTSIPTTYLTQPFLLGQEAHFLPPVMELPTGSASDTILADSGPLLSHTLVSLL